MEHLVTKNIFSDKQLNKYAPDYSPHDVILRMQERRSMFKDIHSHNCNNIIANSNWNRKHFKRVKDDYKISKEILKLRNDFHNMNMKNQIMFKRFVKSSALRPDLNYNCDLLLNDIKVLHEDTNQCIQDIEEDINQLVLYNNSEFKISSKPKLDKILTGSSSNNKINSPKTNEISPRNVSDGYFAEHTIRIECSLDAREISTESTDNFEVEYEHTLPPISDRVDLKINTQHNCYSQGNDLQTLLIMMAISKPNISDGLEIYPPHSDNGEDYTKFGTETIPEVQNSISPKIGNVEDILHIIPFKIEMNEKELSISKKFFKKWKDYVVKRKEVMGKQRQASLNNFFDKLSKKKFNAKHVADSVNKTKVIVQDYETYQHRYKVQKHIIALQKAKLEEQNRIIEELKYNKIIEASRHSIDVMKDEVRKTYYEIDRQLKPKIKCLTNELKLHEIEEPSLVLHCLKVPQFLQRMEKRAREREEKHAIIRERRRQMEEERIRLKQQAEIAKAEMDKEEKMKRIQELRQKRRKEKIETIRRKQYAARLRSLIVMADLHYEKTLTLKYGIRPFKLLLQIKRDNIEKAKQHYILHLKMNIFYSWMWHTEDMLLERSFIADEFYRKKMLKKVFGGLKLNVYSYTLKKQVATDYYDLYVTQLVFRKYREAINIVRKENQAKWQKAVLYYNSNLLFKIITCWTTLPALMALKREQEARKARWREKVLTVVPDYIPPDD